MQSSRHCYKAISCHQDQEVLCRTVILSSRPCSWYQATLHCRTSPCTQAVFIHCLQLHRQQLSNLLAWLMLQLHPHYSPCYLEHGGSCLLRQQHSLQSLALTLLMDRCGKHMRPHKGRLTGSCTCSTNFSSSSSTTSSTNLLLWVCTQQSHLHRTRARTAQQVSLQGSSSQLKICHQ